MSALKKALGTILILTLILTIGRGIVPTTNANPVVALQGLPAITIRNDGTITPQTDYIKQNGTTYTLTDKLSQNYVIVIDCNNIVFDGQGRTINGTVQDSELRDFGLKGYNSQGITLEGVANVTVKDVTVLGFTAIKSIYVHNCMDISFFRVLTDQTLYVISSDHILISECSAPTMRLWEVKYSTVFGSNMSLGLDGSENNTIYNNNIAYAVADAGLSNNWDNGSFGNYWSDYKTKYPNASEIGNTGIANEPYVINTLYSDKPYLSQDANNIDHYPLLTPVSFASPMPTTSPPSFPAELTTPSVAIASILIIAGVVVGALYYKKKTLTIKRRENE